MRKRNKKLREKDEDTKLEEKAKITEKYLYKNKKEEKKLTLTCNTTLCARSKKRFCKNFDFNALENVLGYAQSFHFFLLENYIDTTPQR